MAMTRTRKGKDIPAEGFTPASATPSRVTSSGDPHTVPFAKSRDIRLAREVVHQAPEFRRERVTTLRLALQHNRLILSGERLAAKLCDDARYEPEQSV